jgi:putative heme-binding domain-containing protein
MTQTGYYHRQGGPYPPLTQKLDSITTERHQAAAYAGLCIYDADVFPAEYRGRLLMGNLHGSAINQDTLTRNGATYVQHNLKDEHNDGGDRNYNGSLDFLQANDAWFMPVSTKIGPDGCVYIMDWYDRYHCYQDANRDSPGLDRLKGRIYRISYGDAPLAKPFDLGKASQEELLKLLSHPNVWWRRTAQRILNEKFTEDLVPKLERMALDVRPEDNNAHMHALWLLVSQSVLTSEFHQKLFAHADPAIRNWAVRAVGQSGQAKSEVYAKLQAMANDPSPDVRVQVPIAAGRLTDADPLPVLFAMLANVENAKDPLIPRILYNNLKPLAPTRGKEILAYLEANPPVQAAWRDSVAQWIRTAINFGGRDTKDIVADIKKALGEKGGDGQQLAQVLQSAADALGVLPQQDRARAFEQDKATRDAIGRLAVEPSPAQLPALTMALWWRDAKAIEAARKIVADPSAKAPVRVALLRGLADARIEGNAEAFAALSGDANAPILLRQVAADALGAMNNAQAAQALVRQYADMPADLRPMALNALTRSVAAAQALLAAVQDKKIPATDVTSNHVRQIMALNNADLAQRVTSVWGKVKTERDPERVKVVEHYRQVVNAGKGDAVAGWAVFQKTCAQCHTIYGQGGQVGPDLTGVGRDDLTAVLTNVLDPNLVIGKPYFVHVARTKSGTVFSGLLVEESADRIVLKDQTKTEAINRKDLDKLVVPEISMMPEGLEKTLSDQEFRDLVAFLLTREPPAQRPPPAAAAAPAGGK